MIGVEQRKMNINTMIFNKGERSRWRLGKERGGGGGVGGGGGGGKFIQS